MGPLYAQILNDEMPGVKAALDVVVKANEHHFAMWFKDEPFDVNAFLEKTSSVSSSIVDVLNPPPEKKRKHFALDRDFEDSIVVGTKTSDYVSRIDVLKLVVAVNNRWNWDSNSDALRTLVIPQWRARSKDEEFHLVEEFDPNEHVEIVQELHDSLKE